MDALDTSQDKIESKAQQMLAKLRQRLKASTIAKDRDSLEMPSTTKGSTFSAEKEFVSSGDLTSTMENPTVSTQKEVISTETFNTIAQTHPAVLSESPLSVPEEGHIHFEENRIIGMVKSLDPSQRKNTLKPEAVRIHNSEISIPLKPSLLTGEENASSSDIVC